MVKPVIYIAISLTFLVFSSYSQENLVFNGDFEDFSSCPVSIGDFSCSYWFSPIITTPDYYSSCNTNDCGVPTNSYGNQNPHSGNSYSGITLNAEDGYREYLAIRLKEPLTMMGHYSLTFYVSSSDWGKYGSNNLGAFLVDDTSNLNTVLMMSGTPAIISSSNMVFETEVLFDTLNWIKLSFDYVSRGCEEFLILGNFRPQNETNFGQNFGPGIDSYYYIDDVSLIKTTEDDLIPNVFTPNGDGVNDYFKIDCIDFKSLTIVNRWGNLVFESTDGGKWDGGDNVDGVYYYILESNCEFKKTGFIELVR